MCEFQHFNNKKTKHFINISLPQTSISTTILNIPLLHSFAVKQQIYFSSCSSHVIYITYHLKESLFSNKCEPYFF